ncbi:hypothetical protein NC652_025463 [Populus alba x Populus x berolinensis]|uniref:NADH dehydrogenase [ubiquinone] 1 beta subcomplex subunit 7 n=1 Tax=Populus alba x Populus x berolinensis TaxID=444605 RepID=A0AAD6Q9I3_9ROSI|nr:hypothetical protein NC652_025463 [Populus alba x Populus x berolinensis]KAJ6981878.1 hypothetical protein NC653_025084 [Populus alba x Populus x berolinensis]
MEVPGSSKPMIATQEEMAEARVPIPYRDQCAHLLIPLNKCRHADVRTSAMFMRSVSMSLSWRECFRCRRSVKLRPNSNNHTSKEPSLSSPRLRMLSLCFFQCSERRPNYRRVDW